MKISEEQLLSRIITLSKKFIAIPSTASNSAALYAVLEVAKKELEGHFAKEEFENHGIPSLLVHNAAKGTKHFKIILNAHLDVVPGKEEQFHPFEKDGKLYGRGAYDMKAAAVMIVLFQQLANEIQYPLALQLVTDEEKVSDTGTGHQVKNGINADFVIVGEAGTNMQIKNKAKGHMALKLTASGVSAHGAYPWSGENAIIYMHEVIGVLKKLYPTPKSPVWADTVTVSRIETTNLAHNKIPDHCSIYLDVRYIDNPKHIIETIRRNIHEKVAIEKIIHVPSHYIDPNNRYFQLLRQTAEKILGNPVAIIEGHGGSDVCFYPNAGIEFGPIGENHHADDEWVDIQSLETYYQILQNFLFAVKKL